MSENIDGAFEVDCLLIGEKSCLFASGTDPQTGQYPDLPTTSICIAPSGIFQKLGADWVQISGAGSTGGTGGTTVTQRKALRTDYSDTQYSYLGYADRICQLDWSVSPSVQRFAMIGSLETNWDNRENLNYGA
jgi:hypothetical protein